MKRSRLLAATPGLLLLLVAATHDPARHHRLAADSPALGQPLPRLQGTFTYTSQGSDDVEQVIDRGTAGMSFLTRPLARNRLRKATRAYQLLTIGCTRTTVSIAHDNRAPIVTPADGRTINVKRDSGEAVAVNTVWEQGSLKQTFMVKEGSRENLYSLSPDGQKLIMQVTLRSPRLPVPIVYKLDYKRKA